MLGAWREVLIIFFQAGVAPSLSWLTGLCHGQGRGQETGAEQQLGSVPPWPALHSHKFSNAGCWQVERDAAPTGPAPARRRRLHARALRLRCKRGRRESEGRAEPRALARRDGPFLSHSGKRGSPSRAVDEAPRRGFPAVPLAVPVDLCLTGSSSRLALNCLERLTFACSVYHGITFEQHLAQDPKSHHLCAPLLPSP